jgi:hypothetical protein
VGAEFSMQRHGHDEANIDAFAILLKVPKMMLKLKNTLDPY